MNGNGAFNGQILVDKLAKLNSSQQSIETLSHWCIFHRKKAQQVVETWERQFYCSPRDQRVSFLYLANDILQNSRRKGMEFVGEFYKVLPGTLHDVIENGDEVGRKAALRLVDIWEERKVFSLRGQTLKEDLLGRSGKSISYKLKQPTGDMLEKLILSFRHVYDGVDEDTLIGKCTTAISSVEKAEEEIGSDTNSGSADGSRVASELQAQNAVLRECIDQLKVVESSRTTLASHLREALQEQELKIEQLRRQLKVAQFRFDQVEKLLAGKSPPPPPPPPEQDLDEVPPPPPESSYSEAPPPPNFPPMSPVGAPLPPIYYTPQQPQGTTLSEEQKHKAAAADMAANLASSSNSAQMLSYVLSNLAAEGMISQSMSEEFTSDSSKRPRLNDGGLSSVPCYLPQPQQQLQSFSTNQLPPQPPLPPLPPPMQLASPAPPPQFGQTSGPYTYGSPLQPPQMLLPIAPPMQSPMPSFQMAGMPPYPGSNNPFSFPGSDGSGFFAPPPYPVAPPPNSLQ